MSRIGSTGAPPISQELGDRGGLNASLYPIGKGLLRMDFGLNLSFLVMTTREARCVAHALLTLADTVEKAEPQLS